MSGSNPFRRDRSSAHTPIPAPPRKDDGDVDATVRFPPLNIDTSSARATTQTKHVQFASPPAPETPLSYSYPSSSASSPESFRHTGPATPSFHRPSTGLPASADPFHSDDSDTSIERPDEAYTRERDPRPSVTPPAAPDAPEWLPAELHGSLGDVAATPAAPDAGRVSHTRTTLGHVPGKGKQAIDVDAFKRLLLTGESGAGAPSGAAVNPVPTTHAAIPGDSSSSTADSASVSRQSILEPITSLSTETPRTSHELDCDDASVERRSLASPVAPQARQKPSVPRTRHGKKLTETNPAITTAMSSVRTDDTPAAAVATPLSHSPTTGAAKDLNKPLPLPPSMDLSSPIAQPESPKLGNSLPARPKRPPTPPLTRRQSQMKGNKPPLVRSTSSRTSPVEDISPSSPTDTQKFPSMMKPPPPPPQRRLNRTSTYGTPSNETPLPVRDASRRPSGSFLADLTGGTNPGLHQPADTPSRTPSSASRTSTSLPGTASPGAPPPLPPPRRMRGLSRSSIDSQRPASSHLRQPSTESSLSVSGTSNATDILADLAALQKEVDALRNSHGGRRVS